MSALAVVEPRSQRDRLEQEALSIPNQARAITVTDQGTLDAAARMLTEVIKPLRKEAADVFDPIIRKAHEAHKEAIAGKAKVEKPLIEAEDILKRSVGGYLAEQDRLRSLEETRIRLEHEARQRQEARDAEIRRREEEQALNEQIAREHAEELERRIETAEAFGDAPEVIAALCNTPEPEPVRLAPEMPVYVPAPTVAPRYVAPAGVSTTQRWKAEVTSLRLLCRAIAEGTVPAHYVEANMTALNGMARANKQALNIPGVRAVADTTVSARGR
jgi:hypothetical protein